MPGATHPCCGRERDFFDWGNRDARRLAQGNSWVNWAILHYGPELFWRQWCAAEAVPGGGVRERLLALWAGRDAARVEVERAAAVEVELRVRNVVVVGDLIFRELGPNPFGALRGVESYLRCWAWTEGFHRREPPPETMEHVDFFVDMRGEVPPGAD
ncbi:hypothetical protein AOQ84DRAFT_378598 [Glonium stellatum]|uniref:Uncharacterized protein n=1 Tax=Glonium stellatum TaxID=574774 RepID=A0A8E2EX13_9PEZI|nr:hypothetical protein AOQ84DRAFT_378598 [Glonium stellatum]